MITKILNSSFVDYDGKKKIPFDKLFVNIYVGDQTQYVPLSELYVKDGDKSRKVNSYKDFVKHYKNNQEVFNSETCMQKINHNLEEISVKHEGVEVPKNYDSTSINPTVGKEVPHGLKRNLSVQEAPSSSNEFYYLAVINGKDEFINADEIYFWEGSTRKYITDPGVDVNKLKNVTLKTQKLGNIPQIYTEKKYVFPKVNAKEDIDVAKQERITYSVESDGSIKTTTEKIDKYFSEQKFITVKETIRRGKKTKEVDVSRIEARNFELNQKGEYVKLRFDGYSKMVKVSDVVDEEGKPIEKISNMHGKSVYIKGENDKLIKTQPLTYEESQLLYNSRKLFYKEKTPPNENTYLRLQNGKYVKELENVQPISYKLATNKKDFDAYLVKKIDADGQESFVIVGKDYFKTTGNRGELKEENATKIQRCDFNSKDCCVVQTSSRKNEVESCKVVRKIDNFAESASEKEKDYALESFNTAYKQGAYDIDDVYINGKKEEIDVNKRFGLYDNTCVADPADNLLQYRGLQTKNLSVKNGKMVHGSKFNIGKGIKESYMVWGQALAYGYGIGAIAGFFAPAAFAVYSIGMAVALPAIPVVNVVYGLYKNVFKTKFKNKQKHDRKNTAKECQKELENLYERMTNSKDFVALSENEFNYQYEHIMERILTLSETATKTSLNPVNGSAAVTKNNVNDAFEYVKNYNKNAKALKASNKVLEKIQNKFDKIDETINNLNKEGRRIPPKLRAKHLKLKRKLESEQTVNAELEEESNILQNYNSTAKMTQVSQERDNLIQKANMLRTAVYFKCFPQSKVVQEVEKENDVTPELLVSEVVKDIEKEFDNIVQLSPLAVSDALQKLDNLLTDEERELLNSKIDLERIREKITQTNVKDLNEEEISLVKEIQKSIPSTLDNLKTAHRKLNNNTEEKQIDDAINNIISYIRRVETEEERIEQEKITNKNEEKLSKKVRWSFKEGISIDSLLISNDDEKMFYDTNMNPEYSNAWIKIKQKLELLFEKLNGESLTKRENLAMKPEVKPEVKEDEVVNKGKEVDKEEGDDKDKEVGKDKKSKDEDAKGKEKSSKLAKGSKKKASKKETVKEAKSPRNPSTGDKEKTVKSRLSEAKLIALLENIEKLGEYEDMYYGSDEDLPSDVVVKIEALKSLIRPDIHLLQKAANNPKYDKYLTRVRKAANIVQHAYSPQNRKLGSLHVN